MEQKEKKMLTLYHFRKGINPQSIMMFKELRWNYQNDTHFLRLRGVMIVTVHCPHEDGPWGYSA